MTNLITKNDLADKIIRPKRLYLTSEDVQDFDDASSCRFTLREPIMADEGFRLVYGLSSFGYAATANTISTRQQNNKLHLILTYLEPEYVYHVPNFIANPDYGVERNVHMELVVPDGFYPTLSVLFEVLNDQYVNYIPSGIRYDVQASDNRIDQSAVAPNETALKLEWSATVYGYSVNVSLANGTNASHIKNKYIHGAGFLQAYQVNRVVKSLQIVPYDEYTTNLYYLLFHNENASKNKPANIPSNLVFEGPNPPPSVYLALNAPLSYVQNLATPPSFIDPNDQFTFHWSFGGANDPLSFTEAVFPFLEVGEPWFSCQTLNYSNLPLQIWYSPRLFPLYVEVDTSLETQNLTVDGFASNLFFRHFPLGADQGAKSFFQAWDQPIMHHMRSSRHQIDSIKIDFLSEGNKWDFFNMAFFIEILFYETPDEEELPSFADVPFQIPTEDAMTSSLQQYSNNFNNPFPIHSTKNESGILRVGSSRSGELKRRR